MLNRIISGDTSRILLVQYLAAAVCILAMLLQWGQHWGVGHSEVRAAVLMIMAWFVAFVIGFAWARAAIVVLIVGPLLAVLSLGSGYRTALHNGVFHAGVLLLTVAVLTALMSVVWPFFDEYV